MSYAKDLTTEQARLHVDLERWAHRGVFLGDDGRAVVTEPSESKGSTVEVETEDVLCARFCDRLDGVVGSSHFDVDAFERHVWYLRDSPTTQGHRLDALRRFQATVVAKHESLFPDDIDDDRDDARRKKSGGGMCAVS